MPPSILCAPLSQSGVARLALTSCVADHDDRQQVAEVNRGVEKLEEGGDGGTLGTLEPCHVKISLAAKLVEWVSIVLDANG